MRGVKSDYCPLGHKKKVYPSGRSRCLICERAKARKWRAENLEKARAIGKKEQAKRRARDPRRNQDEQWRWMLKREYGMTVLQYHALYESQGGKCAICGYSPDDGERLVVDHCHDMGYVRGLLCAKCNSAIGMFDDDPDKAESASVYLRKKGGLDALAE